MESVKYMVVIEDRRGGEWAAATYIEVLTLENARIALAEARSSIKSWECARLSIVATGVSPVARSTLRWYQPGDASCRVEAIVNAAKMRAHRIIEDESGNSEIDDSGVILEETTEAAGDGFWPEHEYTTLLIRWANGDLQSYLMDADAWRAS